MSKRAELAILDPALVLSAAVGDGPIWSHTSEELNINVLRFSRGEGVGWHVNVEVDVLGVVLEGEGLLLVGEAQQQVRAGQIFIIPRGAARAITALSDSFAYLSCHRRRPGLMPGVQQATPQEPPA